MKTYFYLLFFLVVFLSSLISCGQSISLKTKEATNNNSSYQKAQFFAAQEQLDSAMLFLKKAFDEGEENPMKLVLDSNLNKLITHLEFREAIRSLLQKHSTVSHTEMVNPAEPGERILIKGIILDEGTKKPIKNVSVELIQVDIKGLYFSEPTSKYNPRLFAYLKTNELGEFSVSTIKPASYKDDEANEVTPHVHFNLSAEHYRPYNSEFVFGDEPLFEKNGNAEEAPVASLEKTSPIKQYQVRIFLQKQ